MYTYLEEPSPRLFPHFLLFRADLAEPHRVAARGAGAGEAAEATGAADKAGRAAQAAGSQAGNEISRTGTAVRLPVKQEREKRDIIN